MRSAPAYRVKKDHPTPNQEILKAGSVVYACRGYDYGMANDDTLMTGVEHVSVTMSEYGDYPFFTFPRHLLEPIKAVRAKEAGQ